MSEAVLDTTAVRRWKRHIEYRASEAKWHWEVPKHWDVRRLKYLATMNPSKSEIASLPRDTEVSFLPMEKVGEDGSLNLDTKKTIEDVYQGFTYFRDGDVLVAKITPCFENGKGALAIGLENGIGFGTTEFHVLRSKGEIEPKYLELVTRLHAFRGQGISEFTGAAGQQRVPESFLNNYVAPLPPLSEQRAIAAFLDRETARIDALVAKKQRLIELLEEKRQAVISNAVTKGLTSNVDFKFASGNWLSKIPTHWGLKRLKFLCSTTKGLAFKAEAFSKEGTPVVKATDIKEETIREGTTFLPCECDQEFERVRLRPGDILMSTVGSKPEVVGSAVGQVARVPQSLSGALLNQNTVRFELCSEECTYDFLFLAMRSFPFRQYLDLHAHGTANQASLNISDVLDFQLALPPIVEQKAITVAVERLTDKLNVTKVSIEDGVQRLAEYRIALISAAVTGQIDVREEVQLDE